MSIEQATFLMTLLNSTVLGLLFLYLKFSVEKKLKKYEYSIGDANKLNTKMHDRLVEVSNLIKEVKPIPPELVTRLVMTASRLEKHDPSISIALNEFIKLWNDSFLADDISGHINLGDYKSRQVKCYEIIKTIKSKVDNIVR